MAGLLRCVVTPKHVVSPDGGAGDEVVRDALQIRRALTALARNRTVVTLQSPDGLHLGAAVLRTPDVLAVKLDWQSDQPGRPGEMPPSLNVIASGERGLLFFTLHGLMPLAVGLLQANWPETVIQMQSRRHFRVGVRMDGLFITQPGVARRSALRDISEEGVGLLLDPDDWPTESAHRTAVLHLGELTLPVPVLQWVHSGSSSGAGSGRSAGARLGGMSQEHVRQLRCWLAARQAASLAPPFGQG